MLPPKCALYSLCDSSIRPTKKELCQIQVGGQKKFSRCVFRNLTAVGGIEITGCGLLQIGEFPDQELEDLPLFGSFVADQRIGIYGRDTAMQNSLPAVRADGLQQRFEDLPVFVHCPEPSKG